MRMIGPACLAATRTSSSTGAAAYTSFYLTALDYEDEAFERLDLELFEQGLHDMLAMSEVPTMEAIGLAFGLNRTSDPGTVMIWHELLMKRRLAQMGRVKGICRRLLERYVTHVPFEEGSSGDAMLKEAIERLWRKELSENREFVIGAEGLKFLEETPGR